MRFTFADQATRIEKPRSRPLGVLRLVFFGMLIVAVVELAGFATDYWRALHG